MEDDKGMPDLVQQEGESKKDEVSTTNTLKRSRGRPKGSGRLQLLANAGGLPFATAGRSFTPHILTIPVGEDVASKVNLFANESHKTACVLSANGVLSYAVIYRSNCIASTIHEGFFEILSLSGAITGDDNGRQTGSLSVSLSHPDGVVFGGRVTGPLVAALPVQLVLGTFKRNATRSRKRKNPGGPSTKPSPDGNLEMERQTPDINLTITDQEEACDSKMETSTPETTTDQEEAHHSKMKTSALEITVPMIDQEEAHDSKMKTQTLEITFPMTDQVEAQDSKMETPTPETTTDQEEAHDSKMETPPPEITLPMKDQEEAHDSKMEIQTQETTIPMTDQEDARYSKIEVPTPEITLPMTDQEEAHDSKMEIPTPEIILPMTHQEEAHDNENCEKPPTPICDADNSPGKQTTDPVSPLLVERDCTLQLDSDEQTVAPINDDDEKSRNDDEGRKDDVANERDIEQG